MRDTSSSLRLLWVWRRRTASHLNMDKYNWEEHDHFITEDCKGEIDFGEGKKNVYALRRDDDLKQKDKEVQLAVNEFGKGRCVYISGLPYSFENSRLLYRSIIWSSHDEDDLQSWFSTNYNVEVHAYVKNGKYCVVNNTYEPQSTTVYKGDGSSFDLDLDANEIIWYEITLRKRTPEISPGVLLADIFLVFRQMFRHFVAGIEGGVIP